MKKQELAAKFKEHFTDEVGDITGYLDLSEAAEAAGDHETAEKLLLIANDEQTHAHVLKHLVKEAGEACPEEAVAKYHAAKERLEKRFR